MLSIQPPGADWIILSDPNYWFVMTDGDDVITITHLSNGEALPAIAVAGSEYAAVCHAYVSTENEVFVIKGCAVSPDSLKDIMMALSTVKILKYNTKLALNAAAPGAAADEFKTSASLTSLSNGTTIGRSGTGLVYSGYSWRGSSRGGAAPGKPDDLGSPARETMWFAPDQQRAEGRWFWGEYQEFGYDVKLVRATAATAILAVTPSAVKAGAKGVDVTIWGHNLPASLTAADVDLGAGVTVARVVSATPGKAVLSVDVAASAPAGQRDVGIGGAVLEKAFPVYRKVDYLKVTPETSLARLGGTKFAKGYQQFEAIGYDNGLDGKPNTGDDVAIGPVDATWSMQEFMSVYYDDDMKYVGALSPTAFFTPGLEGPNPERRFSRNNYGEVWVVATAKGEKDKFGKPLSARSYLVVTVPMYQRFDQPEVSR